MGRRFICSQGLISFRSSPSVIINSECFGGEDRDLLALPLCKRVEIYEFARSYTDKLLVVDDGERSIVISPSIFPSSSLCAVFMFDMSARSLYRLIKLCGAQEMFECSCYADVKRARISREIMLLEEPFSRFCRDIKRCFYGMDRLKRAKSAEEQSRVILEQCHRVSLFTGCPVEVEIAEGEYSNTDLPLLTAFLFTMLSSARKNAPDREARIYISSRAGSALVNVGFNCHLPVCISKEMIEWEGIAADRYMSLHTTEENGAVSVEFHPHRYDLSAILGIKQSELVFLK